MDKPPEKKSAGDAAYALAKGTLGAIPVAGHLASEVLTLALATPLEQRKTKWLGELAEVINELQREVAGFKVEQLQQNDRFVTVAAHAAQAALRTHQEAKLAALRNAVKNSVLMEKIAEDRQLMFVRFVDEFTPSHLRLLALLDGPAKWKDTHGINDHGRSLGGLGDMIGDCLPELRGNAEFMQQLYRDLQVRGLLEQGQAFGISMSAMGMDQKRTTGFGGEFLQFIGDA